MNKIEQFLFDIIGLLIPGFVAMVLPMLILFFVCKLNSFILFNNFFNEFSQSSIKEYTWLILIAIFTILYLLGHVIKVFSIRYYNFMRIIFDKNINVQFIKIKNFLWKYLSKEINKSSNLFIDIIFMTSKITIGILEELSRSIGGIFVFQTQGYDSSNEQFYDKVLHQLKIKYGINIKKRTDIRKLNYAIYKLSQIIQDTNTIKTLTNTFLAKYNFYRSLSFIFFINIMFLVYIHITDEVKDITNFYISLFCLIIFWYTFHEKFKRYWELSGNESLMGIYFYLFYKDKIENNIITKSYS